MDIDFIKTYCVKCEKSRSCFMTKQLNPKMTCLILEEKLQGKKEN